MSPLGEAYRRARGNRGGTGDQEPHPEARQEARQEPQGTAQGVPPGEAPDGAGTRSAGVRRPSVTQAFVPARRPPSRDGKGFDTQSIPTAGVADDVLSRACRVSAFAEGALRPGSDALAGLRAAIYAAGLERPPATILVVSPMSGAGTTVVAVGLAGELARDLSRQVLLVDADVRSPGVASALGVDAAYGLADVLDMHADVGEAILFSEVDNLSALVLRPNPAGAWIKGASKITAESLASAAAKEVFGVLESAFDYVVIDAGATEESAAARVLAGRSTGVVFVLPVGVTRMRARAACSAVETAGGRTVGVVLTGA